VATAARFLVRVAVDAVAKEAAHWKQAYKPLTLANLLSTGWKQPGLALLTLTVFVLSIGTLLTAQSALRDDVLAWKLYETLMGSTALAVPV